MDDLRQSLRPPFVEASPAKTLLINMGMKYGGHFLKKFPWCPTLDQARYRGGRAKYGDTGYAYVFRPNAQDCK
jgi:hypothetical protein